MCLRIRCWFHNGAGDLWRASDLELCLVDLPGPFNVCVTEYNLKRERKDPRFDTE